LTCSNGDSCTTCSENSNEENGQCICEFNYYTTPGTTFGYIYLYVFDILWDIDEFDVFNGRYSCTKIFDFQVPANWRIDLGKFRCSAWTEDAGDYS
jgi:hypothetical protein